MFQVAICDDDKIFCSYFKECLESVIKKQDTQCHISVWYKGNELMEYLTKENRIVIMN